MKRPDPSQVSRRGRGRLLRPPVLFCLVLLAAAGCGSGERGVRIRFWNGFTGPDGRTMLRIVRRFNREQSGVHVVMQRMDWGTYYNKLMVTGIGGRAPEVFIVHADVLRRFERARFLQPVDEFMHPGGLTPDQFDANIWKAVGYRGRHYGVPLDVHVLGLYYNKRLFREAGLVDTNGKVRVPTNRAEFLEAARRMTRDLDGDGRPDQWGFVFTWFRTNVYTIMAQFGGSFFSADGTRCLLNSPENIEALTFCADLIHKYKVAPPPQNFDAWIGFRQGKVGMAFEGIYMLASLEKQTDLEFGGAPLPVLGRRRAAWANSHVLCIRAGLPEEKKQAAWKFVRFLSDHSLDWAAGGQIPVRPALRASPRFKAMPVQSQFAKELPYIVYGPPVPFIFEAFTEFDAAVEKVLRGSAKPAEALAEAQGRIEKIMERDRAIMARAKGRQGP